MLGIGVNVAVDVDSLPRGRRGGRGHARASRPTTSSRRSRRCSRALETPPGQDRGARSTACASATRCAGSRVRWQDGEGTGAGIDDDGALLVTLPNGGQTSLAAGEVTLSARRLKRARQRRREKRAPCAWRCANSSHSAWRRGPRCERISSSRSRYGRAAGASTRSCRLVARASGDLLQMLNIIASSSVGSSASLERVGQRVASAPRRSACAARREPVERLEVAVERLRRDELAARRSSSARRSRSYGTSCSGAPARGRRSAPTRRAAAPPRAGAPPRTRRSTPAGRGGRAGRAARARAGRRGRRRPATRSISALSARLTSCSGRVALGVVVDAQQRGVLLRGRAGRRSPHSARTSRPALRIEHQQRLRATAARRLGSRSTIAHR